MAASDAAVPDVTCIHGREACHAKRDEYYACAGEIEQACSKVVADVPFHLTACIASAEDKSRDCSSLRASYVEACPQKSWVRYWDERVRRGLPLRVGVK